jgi:hypothetical protein
MQKGMTAETESEGGATVVVQEVARETAETAVATHRNIRIALAT